MCGRRGLIFPTFTSGLAVAGQNHADRLKLRLQLGSCVQVRPEETSMTGSNNIIVQPRDLKLLRTTALLRAIDREQARTIGTFTSTTRVNATMLRLVRAGL